MRKFLLIPALAALAGAVWAQSDESSAEDARYEQVCTQWAQEDGVEPSELADWLKMCVEDLRVSDSEGQGSGSDEPPTREME